jgi:hypothetical protein
MDGLGTHPLTGWLTTGLLPGLAPGEPGASPPFFVRREVFRYSRPRRAPERGPALRLATSPCCCGRPT